MITAETLDEIRASITVYRVVDGAEVDRKLAFPREAVRYSTRTAAAAAARELGQFSAKLDAVREVFVKSGIIRE